MKKVYEYDFLGRKLVIEIGELAKQTNGAVLVRYGDTVVLSTAVMSPNMGTGDFFPLTILYQEKLYSVGKIPGGFIKREGRPTDAATLAARLIDRPIRPMFNENFRNEIQVVNTILSVEQDCDPALTALFGTSLSLGISNIPFEGPVAGVQVGKIDGKLVINPTTEEQENTTIDLKVAGTTEAINMVESGSKEVSEDEMLEALMFGHEHVKMLCEIQKEIISDVSPVKVVLEEAKIDEARQKQSFRSRANEIIIDKRSEPNVEIVGADLVNRKLLDGLDGKMLSINSLKSDSFSALTSLSPSALILSSCSADLSASDKASSLLSSLVIFTQSSNSLSLCLSIRISFILDFLQRAVFAYSHL